MSELGSEIESATDTDTDIGVLPVAGPRTSWRVLAHLAGAHRWLAVAGVLSLIGQAALGLVPPAVVGWIVDRILDGDDPSSLVPAALLLLLAALAEAVLTGTSVALVARFGESVLASLRERVLHRALHSSHDHLERVGTGDLLSRISNDVAIVSEAIREAFPYLITAFFTVLVTGVGLVVVDWRFALAAACALPVQLLTVRRHLRVTQPLYAEHRRVDSSRSQAVLDAVTGVATIRAFRLGARQLTDIRRHSERMTDIGISRTRHQTSFYARLNIAEFVGLAAVLVVGWFAVGAEAVSMGAATTAALYFMQIFDPINTLLGLADDVQMASASLQRLVGVLELETPIDTGTAATPAGAEVRIEGVSFAYRGGPTVLADVDLTIRSGERLALVGTTGAGKSTLARLIAGVHHPDAGTVRLGGVATTDLDPARTREMVVLVTQEAHVFTGPLAEDLRLARADATEEDLVQALEVAGAAEWVARLPDGLATEVGHGAHALSDTEALEVALARLWLADPPIAVLDEATADAGSASARSVEQSAERVLSGRTSVVVAHRLTQAVSADRVAVVDAGRLIELGTHDELVALGGVYAALWSAWSTSRVG